MDNFELHIKTEFLNETSELLEALEESFIEFEKKPTKSELIDKIFRLFHTVKGGAMSVGFQHLGSFAHLVETLLVLLRDKIIIADAEIVSVLLKANDRLLTYVAALRKDFVKEVFVGDISAEVSEMIAQGQPHKLTDPSSSLTQKSEIQSSEPASEIGFEIFSTEPYFPEAKSPSNQSMDEIVNKFGAIQLKSYLIAMKMTHLCADNQKEAMDVLKQEIENCLRETKKLINSFEKAES